MTHNTTPIDNFNYFTICKTCTDDECCAEPYFIFCARNEIKKIKDFIKKFPKRFQKFLDIDTISYKNKEYEYYGFKKIRGKCIFLKGKRRCMIHECKPLHCRCWPLIWSWEEESNKLFIYIDEDPSCPLIEVLAENELWIETMKRIIRMEVQVMPKVDRFAFASLESGTTLRLIDILDLKD